MTSYPLRTAISVFIILCIFFIPAVSTAQNFPAVLIEDEDSGEVTPLKMTELDIDVSVVSNIATTTMSMTFYNDLDRVLEGRMVFPLGEGQTVSRFAMTIGGHLREGVVVEKAKGRAVFDSVVRQQIDPGLLEWTKGNNFKARIYPVPAKGYKKIIVAFEQELIDAENSYLYLLPLNFKEKVDKFKVRAEVFKQEIKPELKKNEIENFEFSKWQESYVAEAEHADYLPAGQLAFSLPKEKDRQRVFIEKDQDNSGHSYFYVSIDPKIKQASKELPKKICLLWDVSTSGAARDIEKEFLVLKNYFKKLKKSAVHVVLFSSEVISEKVFDLNNETKELFEYLRNAEYDGGTQLGAIDLSLYKCDEFILSSDGLSNFGESEITLSDTPVAVINSFKSADHSCLKYISQAAGGVYINLNKVTSEEAVEALSSQAYLFISAEYDSKSIKETYPRISTPVNKDFSIAGILLKDEAEIKLNFGFGNRVKYSKKIRLNKSENSDNSSLIKRIWAQKKISELDMMYEKNKEELTRLGKELGIVTRSTSLIVLDRIEDYVQHRIVPPEHMKAEYLKMLQKEERETERTEKKHMDSIIKSFEEQVKWWDTEYPVKGSKVKKSGHNGTISRMTTQRNSEVAASMPVYDSVEEERFTLEEMVVAGEKRGPEVPVSGDFSAIKLSKWDSKTPYLKKLKKAADDNAYNVYLELKNDYQNSSAFYLDVADFFMEKKQPELALRILTNIAEMETENHQLLRILGYRLMQLGYYKYAIAVFKEVLEIREEEPQSYRDLALAYDADRQYQMAVDLFYHVVSKSWDSRFSDIGLIALHEMNAVVARSDTELKLDNIDKRLLKNLPVDIRVVLTWDADNTDMDLWVTDPLKEKCYYQNRNTYLGGRMSNDFTGGYGPEEFMLKKAKAGKYKIQVDYYGNHQQTISGATTIQVMLYTDFGKPNEKQKAITLRLKDEKEVIDVGEFIFGDE